MHKEYLYEPLKKCWIGNTEILDISYKKLTNRRRTSDKKQLRIKKKNLIY